MEQRAIYNAVCERGYRANWTEKQFVARQVAKLAEELGEMAWEMVLNGGAFRSTEDGLDALLRDMADEARAAFDCKTYWGEVELDDCCIPDMRAEATDMLVVLFCLCEAMSEIDGQPFDLVQAALKKSTSDIGRGVRGE